MRNDADRQQKLAESQKVMSEVQAHFTRVMSAFDDALAEPLAAAKDLLAARMRDTADPRATLGQFEAERVHLEAVRSLLDSVLLELRGQAAQWEQRAMTAVAAGDHDLARVSLEEIERIMSRVHLAEAELTEHTHLRDAYAASIESLHARIANE